MTDRQDHDLLVERRASEIAASFSNVPVPLALLDIPGFRIRAVNQSLLEVAGMTAAELIGWSAADFSPPERRTAVLEAQHAIADGRLDAFQAGRVFHLPNGRTIEATVWARRIEVEGVPWGLGLALTEHGSDLGRLPPFGGADVDVMMAVTNHEWILEHVSADASRVVGSDADKLIGSSLLGLIHPDDGPEFITSVAAAGTSLKSTVACQVRFRTSDGDWRDTTCFVSVLCDHSPPRLGLAVTRASPSARSRSKKREETLEQVLWRIAMELRSVGVTSDELSAVTRSSPQRAAQLSARQWEIVQRLVQGEGSTRIAAAMYLSPSTIRNHLSAIYRKFGVHSQVELLALLRAGTLGPHPEPTTAASSASSLN
jgi:PAS domain S-box-containing protein